MNILITGGAGFIGSSTIRHIINNTDHTVINVDKLTYAGNLESLISVSSDPRYFFEQVDICDINEMKRIFGHYKPDKILHLAAESHVDRSIDAPDAFIQTNVVGTYTLLDAARNYYNNLSTRQKKTFRFHHVSTDEVYGDLDKNADSFKEDTPYSPNSPYSATKASSDHLVRAWHRTYGLPTLITNCTNNFGPYQYPEKFIPLVILNAIAGKSLPIYGDGTQVRDWLYVEDHVYALIKILEDGMVGETYNIGATNEKQNLEIVEMVCDILDRLIPLENSRIKKYRNLITFVEDRPGHDKRYAIDASKVEKTMGWKPENTFENNLYKTIKWYLNNKDWCNSFEDSNCYSTRQGLIREH